MKKKIKIIPGGLETVPGFKFSALKCGIRYKNRLDYSLIMSEKNCQAAGVFTTNKICAAPVKLSKKRIKNKIKAILINATNANACTGQEGEKNVFSLTEDLAKKAKISGKSVLMASTGIIGHQLPVKKMLASHENLLKSLSASKGKLIHKAIMTTDTKEKKIAVNFETSQGSFVLAGTAKGSGMIAPNMATLLAFILTNAPLKKRDLNLIFKKIIKKTLNAINIDGDMSTNDTALLLSPLEQKTLEKPSDLQIFSDSLEIVLTELGKMLVADGEGVTKSVEIIVKRAANDREAEKIVKTISESLLVKTAFFGEDPNWGRIAMAVGAAGAKVKEEKLSIFFDKISLIKNGIPGTSNSQKLKKILSKKTFSVTVDLGLGSGQASMLTSDLSYKYIKINGEYST